MFENYTNLSNEVSSVWREEGAIFQFVVQNVSGQMGKPIWIIRRHGGRFECFLNLKSTANSGIEKKKANVSSD
jgi:hypothetical protein